MAVYIFYSYSKLLKIYTSLFIFTYFTSSILQICFFAIYIWKLYIIHSVYYNNIQNGDTQQGLPPGYEAKWI